MSDVVLGIVKVGLIGHDSQSLREVRKGSVIFVDMIDNTGVEGRLTAFNDEGIEIDTSQKYRANSKFVEYKKIRGITIRGEGY